MAEKLKNFLKKMGEDPQLRDKFKQDAHGAMDEHDLSEEEKQLILSGDKEKIKQESGADDSDVNFLIV